jgi:uncharacterized Fe-S cluster-containing radical SAM superfamily protein
MCFGAGEPGGFDVYLFGIGPARVVGCDLVCEHSNKYQENADGRTKSGQGLCSDKVVQMILRAAFGAKAGNHKLCGLLLLCHRFSLRLA